MAEIVISLVIASILFALAYMLRASHKKEILREKTYKRTYATIAKVLPEASSSVYYVSFDYNGAQITAWAGHYKLKPKTLVLTGEIVEIGCFFAKNGTPRAVIFDERLISVSESMPAFYKSLTILGIVFLFVAAGMFVGIFS